MPCMVGGAMFTSSRNRMPRPLVGRNSGGYQRLTPVPSPLSWATGRPRRSVGASCESRTSTKSRPFALATCATTLDLPTPGGPQIMVLRGSCWATRALRYWASSDGVRDKRKLLRRLWFESALVVKRTQPDRKPGRKPYCRVVWSGGAGIDGHRPCQQPVVVVGPRTVSRARNGAEPFP